MCTEYIKVEHLKKKKAKLFSPKLRFVVVVFLSPFPIVTGKTEIVRGSICLNVFSVSSGQIYSIHIPENRRENNVQIEVFFFSHLCPLLLLCIHIYVSRGGTSWLTTRRFWV